MAAQQHLIFEVRLLYVKPAPWRRFSLPRTGTFLELHEAIQDACDWTDSHLWQFTDTDGEPIAGPQRDDPLGRQGEDEPDAKEVNLLDWFRHSKTCLYTYDFGDDWEHEVTLVGVETLERPGSRRLLAGKWCFPPEDCGGPPGFQRCVQAARTGRDPWNDGGDFLDWLGEWRPETFDLAEARKWFESGAMEC